MHLAGVLVAELVEPVGRDLVRVGEEVRLAVLDLRDLRLDAESELLQDHVRVAGRLRFRRPLLEVRVADDLHLLGRRVLDPLVRARPGGRDVQVLGLRARREDERERQRELVEELRVGPREVERHRVPVDDDSLREVARLRRLHARVAALDGVVPGARVRAVADLEQALERRLDVVAGERLAVGELDPVAQRELPGLAPVRGRRDRGGQVRDELRALLPAGMREAHEPVMGEDQELPLLQRVVDLRVRRAGRRRVGQRDQRATFVSGRLGGALLLATAACDEGHQNQDRRRQQHQTLHDNSLRRD